MTAGFADQTPIRENVHQAELVIHHAVRTSRFSLSHFWLCSACRCLTLGTTMCPASIEFSMPNVNRSLQGHRNCFARQVFFGSYFLKNSQYLERIEEVPLTITVSRRGQACRSAGAPNRRATTHRLEHKRFLDDRYLPFIFFPRGRTGDYSFFRRVSVCHHD